MRRGSRFPLWVTVLLPTFGLQAHSSAQLATQPSVTVPVTAEQTTRIDQASSTEALIELAKDFLFSRERAAAVQCVEQICRKNPALLTDPARQSSRMWNEFWFTTRADIRETGLRAEDAGGRVELALWLYEAGLTIPAQRMLSKALSLDPAMPRARELARQWRLHTGGPVEFDLHYGLRHRLLVETIKDENIDLVPRGQRAFLLLPFRYQPERTPFTLRSSELKITADGQGGTVIRGIALLEKTAGSPGPKPGGNEPANLQPQPDSDPLWEQIQIDRLPEGKGHILTCLNLTPPPELLRDPSRPRPDRRAGTRDRTAPDNRRQARPAGGHAMFVVELPVTTKVVRCSYANLTELTLDMDFIKALTEPFADQSPAVQKESLGFLAARTSSADPAVARAAIAKLLMIAAAADEAPAASPATQPARPTLAQRIIQQALLSAVSHPHPMVRRAAVRGLSSLDHEVARETCELIRDADSMPLVYLVEELEQLLREHAQTAPSQPTGDTEPSPQAAPASDGVSAPAASSAPPNAFNLLRCCLGSNDPKGLRAAINLVLQDGSPQALAALSGSSPQAMAMLTENWSRLPNNAAREAGLRALVMQGNPEALAMVRERIEATPLVVTDVHDPILSLLRENVPDAQVEHRLAVLNQVDFSAVESSETLVQMLKEFAEARKSPLSRMALVQFAIAHQRGPHPSPLPRGSSTDAEKTPPSAFDLLLGELAADANAEVSRAAAGALLAAGRAQLLHKRLATADIVVRRDLAEALVQDKPLRELDGLPMFLALQLAETDARTVRSSLASISLLYKRTPPQRIWRISLAIRQVVDVERLIRWSADHDEAVAHHASDLLARLLGLSEEEAADWARAGDAESRLGLFQAREARRQFAIGGRFGCLVLLDLVRGGPAGVQRRESIPLTSTHVTIEPAGTMGLRMLAEGREVGKMADGVAVADWDINAADLLRYALRSPDSENAKLPEDIDTEPLTRPVSCVLHRDRLGGWAGECAVTGNEGPRPDARAWLPASARIILEPLAP